MQFKFLAALLLVGACFVQVSVAHPQDTDLQRSIIDPLIAQAQKAIDQLKQILKEQIKTALDDFNKLEDQVQQISETAIAAAKEQDDNLIAKVQEQINEIKDEAAKQGVDISDCISKREDDFTNLFNEFLQDELNSVGKEIDEALRIIYEGIIIVTDSDKSVEIEDLPAKLKACGTDMSSIPCISNVIVEVAKLQADHSDKINKKNKEVTDFVNGIKDRLEACAATQLESADLEAAGIVADVAKCAADKIGADYKHM